MNARRARGVTLIELVVTIVVIGVAVGGILQMFVLTLAHGADPQVQQQALAVAQGYLDEILARPASDPDGAEGGEARADFDDVRDYAGLDEVPTDQTGAAWPGLGDYRVAVAVTPVTLGPASAQAPALRVEVTVRRAPDFTVTLDGYRAIY